jgi:effector-binding domain-containing protein
MDVLAGPAVAVMPERPTAGIRVNTPFRGMFAVRDELMKELYAGLAAQNVTHGLTFFRLHVVDMDGTMDVEVGVLTDGPADSSGRITPGVLPAGRYAAMTYVGHGRRANGTLIDWIRAHDLPMDVTEDPRGDAFACRYEAYLTDPRTERMKTRWQIELAIRLAD